MSPRLPAYIAGGPKVSDLAYRIVVRTLAEQKRPITMPALADDLGVDEAEILRALEELQSVGVLEGSPEDD